MSRPPVLEWADPVRALALAAVVVWHILLTVVSPQAERLPLYPVTISIGVTARVAVLVFILLSGYLLGRHWNSRSSVSAAVRPYLRRRIIRIVPPYWAALCLCLAAAIWLGLDKPGDTVWDASLPLTTERIVRSFTLTTDFGNMVPLGHPLWTIPVEFHLYFLAPLAVLMTRRWAVTGLGVGLTVALGLTIAFPAPYFPLAFTFAFWTGLRRDRSDRSIRTVAGSVLPLALAGVIVACVLIAFGDLDASRRNYLIVDALTAPVILAAFVHGDSDGGRTLMTLLQRRWLQWIGMRSYTYYLIHALLLEASWRFFIKQTGTWWVDAALLALVAVPLLVLTGEGFYRSVELPCARWASSARGRAPAITSPRTSAE